MREVRRWRCVDIQLCTLALAIASQFYYPLIPVISKTRTRNFVARVMFIMKLRNAKKNTIFGSTVMELIQQFTSVQSKKEEHGLCKRIFTTISNLLKILIKKTY